MAPDGAGTERSWTRRVPPVVAAFAPDRRLTLAAVLLAVVVVVVSLLPRRHWTATVAFRPQAQGLPTSSLAGIAAQFGVSLPLESQQESPEFYAELITSRTVLRPIVRRTYFTTDGKKTALLDWYRIDAGTPARDTAKAVDLLQQHVSVSTGLKTGVVRFDVDDRDPMVAFGLAADILAQVDTYNLVTRQTRARLEREFTQTRVDSSRDAVRRAEDTLASFLQRNRAWSDAPELQFQHDRLQREVDLRQQVYSDLVQSLERSKIEEVRNTPVITVFEAPIVPARPDPRHLLLRAVVTFLVVIGAGIVWRMLAEPLGSGSGPGEDRVVRGGGNAR